MEVHGRCLRQCSLRDFFAILEYELLDRHRFRSQEEARQAVFDFIEGRFNPHRRHSSLSCASPVRCEIGHVHAARPVSRLLSTESAQPHLCPYT